jgi:hypothetical protein
LRRLAETIIVKDIKSPDRLLDETALFLHRVESNLPPEERRILEQLHEFDPTLVGTKALIVDDDIRNTFALTSVLERLRSDFAVVLLDVAMPDMDGYETAALLRQRERSRDIPRVVSRA